MKIAVYAICKNEAKFVETFLNSVKDADLVCITDTGSTDGTVERFKEVSEKLGISSKVDVKTSFIAPWRFDDARNVSLSMVPPDFDVVICLDLDEVLLPGWRESIEKNWTPETTRLRYYYVWNWKEDGSEGITYMADKIHSRKGYRWRMPVHETLHWYDTNKAEGVSTWINDKSLVVHHFADNSKPRSQYLPLLELAVKEDPHNDREAHYYARELMFYGYYEKAIPEFVRHLNLPTAIWKPERAASMRFLARCYWALNDQGAAMVYLKDAVKEAPDQREGWVELAQAYRAWKMWPECKEACEKALAIKERPQSYICEEIAWSDWPQKMLDEALAKLSN